jgi:putative CocE/NonD family hydrolase
MAEFTVRGSGGSGGCFEWGGPNEQRDQVSVIEWLARQSWSNGNVGMTGLSYGGMTPLEAAIQAPEALKTVVVGGIHSDLYTTFATPQGAWLSTADAFSPGFNVLYGIAPPVLGNPQTAVQRPLDQRVCDDVVDLSTSNHLSERHGALWDARRLIDRFDKVTASVLLYQGMLDGLVTGSYHGAQDDWAWQALSNAPKRSIMGQWAHDFPGACASSFCADGKFPTGWRQRDWQGTVFEWLDYWLKGIGAKPGRLGSVDYQDSSGAWHESKEWPPRETRDEVLYLADDELATAAGGTRRSFDAVLNPANTWALTTASSGVTGVPPPPVNPDSALCPRPSDTAVATGLLYTTPAVTNPTVIAGNPFAYLQMDSTQAGGIVSSALLDLGPDFACDASGTPSDVRLMTVGAADLQYHRGGYTPEDFPTATATPVRLDFEGIAVKLAPGHRVGLMLEGPIAHFGQPYAPTIGLNSPAAADSSQLVLPIVEGGWGGGKPQVNYPPRPFLPGPKAGSPRKRAQQPTTNQPAAGGTRGNLPATGADLPLATALAAIAGAAVIAIRRRTRHVPLPGQS